MSKKIFAFLFLILLCRYDAFAQWIVQQSNFPEGVTPYTISAVTEKIAWISGINRTGVVDNTSDWFARTLDGGDHWVAGRMLLPAGHLISCIVAISADTAWVSVGTDTLSSKVGIYKTVDGGNSWIQQNNGLPAEAVFINFVHFFDGKDGITLYDRKGSYCPIFITSDGGATWQRVPDDKNIPLLTGERPNITMYSVAEGVIYWGSIADNVGRIFKSTDRGKSWSVSKCDFQVPDRSLVWPGFKDAQNGMIVALEPTARTNGAAITQDGAVTWTRVTTPPISAHFVRSIPGTAAGYLVTGANYFSSLTIYPGSAFTMDNGATWIKIDDVQRSNPAFASRTVGWAADAFTTSIYKWFIDKKPSLGFNPKGMLEYSVTKTGAYSQPQTVYITNYGQEPLTISAINTGMNARVYGSINLPKSVNSLETAPIQICFAPAVAGPVADSVIFVSNAINAPQLAIHFHGEGLAIAPAQAGVLYVVSANSLYTIDPLTAKTTLVGKTPFTNLQGLAVDPVSLELIGSSTQNTFSNFNYIDANSAFGALMAVVPEGNVRAIAFKADTLYGATPTGKLFRLDLMASQATLLGTAPGVYYHSIAVQPGSGILYGSMQASSGSIKDRIVTINPVNGDTTLIGATGDGLATPSLTFSSSGPLYGIKGTGSTINTLITIDPLTGAATTIGSTGISGLRAMAWATGTTVVEQPDESDAPPEGFALMQNYPNPFNNETVISYVIPRDERVTIKIFDIIGREIKLLNDGVVQAGRHKVIFRAQALSSGVYLCRMTAGQFSAMQKFAIIK